MKTGAIVIWIVAIAVVAAAVFGLPPLLKHQGEKQLSAFLSQPVEIVSFRFNPFLGTTELEAIRIGTGTSIERVSVNLGMIALLQRRVHIQSLELSGVALPVEIQGENVRVAGYLIPKGGEGASQPLDLAVDRGALADIKISLIVGEAKHVIEVSQLLITEFGSTAQDMTARVELSSQVNGGAVEFTGNFATPQNGVGIKGAISLQAFELASVVPGAEGRLNLTQEIEVGFIDAALDGTAEGTVTVLGLSYERLAAKDVRWDGRAAFSLDKIQIEGEATASNIDASPVSAAPVFANGVVHSGVVNMSLKPFSVEIDHTLSINGIQNKTFGELAKLNWQGQTHFASAESYSVKGSGELDGIKPMGLGQVEKVTIGNLDVTPSRIGLAELSLAGGDLLLQRDKSGRIKQMPESEPLPEDKADDKVDDSVNDRAADSAALPDILIDKLQIDRTKFEYVDQSVEPLVDLEFHNIAARVDGFSTTEAFKFEVRADHQADESGEAHVKVAGSTNLSNRSGDIDLDLANFELHEIAPYLGNGIRSGRLQLTSKLKMQLGHVVLDNDVHISKVKIDEGAGGGGDQMSLSTALFLLKDKNDVVELKVPVETDFKNVQVDFDDILQKAMLKAARTTAVTYAQYALQPYGSLLLAKDVLGALTRPKFEPVEFEPGASELNETSRAYINKLGNLLLDKSDLTVTLCGYANTEELAANEDLQSESEEDQLAAQIAALKALAQTRSRLVRDQLNNLGVPKSRLYACTASVESENHPPRVEIAL